MKRLLISTTALAVALAGINPAMLVAQGAPEMVCPADIGPGCAPEQMVPKKKKKQQQAQPEGQGKQAQPEGQGKKKAQPEGEGNNKAQPEGEGKKKAQPEGEGKKKAQPEAQGEGKKKAQPEAQGEGKKKAQPEAQGEGKKKAQPEAQGEGKKKAQPEAQGEGKKKAQPEAQGEGKKKAQPEGQGEGQPQAGAGKKKAQPDDQPGAGKKAQPEGQGRARRDPDPAPAADPVQALDRIVAEEPAAARKAGDDTGRGRPARPAAAAAENDRGPVEMRLSRPEPRRKSSEDFDTRPGADRKAEKKDGGLSDLEKAGLVVLGALVVGSLLNNGNRVVSNTGDRVVVDRGDGRYMLLKDDDALIRYPGSDVQTETFTDGSTRTTVLRADGSRIVTIRDASGRVLRRALVYPDGRQTLLIDDLDDRIQPVDLRDLPRPAPGGLVISTADQDAALRAEMYRLRAGEAGRAYSLQQIRDYPELRALAPTFDVANIAFASGSAAIDPAEAQKLATLGRLMQEMIDRNPAEMFLVEGHTDAVGDAAYNLALSDRRAESLALALSDYFGVPAENMVVQGYGEAELLVPGTADEPRNRRALVRMISPLMQQVAGQ